MKRFFIGPAAALFCCLALSGFAAGTESRYLFVVDTSLSMGRSSAAAQQAVRDLIEEGVDGSMKDGDTLGIWTFNAEVHTGQYPMQRWTRSSAWAIAEGAAQFVQGRRFERAADFEVLIPYLDAVTQASDSLLIIVVTDGSTPVRGTPFDDSINALYRQYQRDMRDARVPFLTMLAVRNRKMVSYSVGSSVGPLTLPKVPEPEATVIPKQPADDTSRAASASAKPVAPPEPQRTRPPSDVPAARAAAPKPETPVPMPADEVPQLASEPIKAPKLVGTPLELPPSPTPSNGTSVPAMESKPAGAPAAPSAEVTPAGRPAETGGIRPAGAAGERQVAQAASRPPRNPASSEAGRSVKPVLESVESVPQDGTSPGRPSEEATPIGLRELFAAVFGGLPLPLAFGTALPLIAVLLWVLTRGARAETRASIISQSMERRP